MMRVFSKIFLFLLVLPVVYGGVYEYEYYFSKPRIQEQNGHMIIRLPGCMQTGVTGEPQLPAFPLMILLPPGETLESLEVIKEKSTRYPLMLPVMPKQPDRPLSMRLPDRTFFKDKEVYEKEEYAVKETISAVHRFRGSNVLLGNIRPLRYYPRSGMVDLAEQIRLRVHTKTDTTVFPENKDINMLEAFIQNPGQLNSYYHESAGGPEQMLIITSNTFAPAFDTLQNFYKKYGIESELISTEDIALSDIHGRDLQERMRNTIREHYLEKGLDYVLLGGNSNIVPHRGLSCKVNSGGTRIYSDNIPADLYYAALDGTWDDNRNNVFGEYNDSSGYDEADLLPELAVGRMPAANIEELQNLIAKSMRYQKEPVVNNMDKHVFFGEFLYNDPESWGSDYLELIVGERNDNGYTTQGIPEQIQISKWYDKDSTDMWNRETVKRELADGRAFLHHNGHANTNYLMKFMTHEVHDSDFVTVNGVDNAHPVIYTHGCNCGGFDYTNCIGSRMVNSPVLAAGGVFNSRYGWFNEGTTEGPSVHLHREFMNALYGMEYFPFGRVHQISKIATAPWVTAEGQFEQNALRWTYYTNNVLGDPAMQIYSDKPHSVNVQYDLSAIEENILQASVSRETTSLPAVNAGISVMNAENELIGYAKSNTEGHVEIPLLSRVNNGDSLFCFLRGGNIIPADTLLQVVGTGAPAVADKYRLQIYPNPFNHGTEIRYRLPEAGEVVITLFDLRGRRVETLSRTYRKPGEYHLRLSAGHLPSGVYFCRLQSNAFTLTKKLLLLK